MVKAFELINNTLLFESEDGEEVIKEARKYGKEYYLDFEETPDENLMRVINRNKFNGQQLKPKTHIMKNLNYVPLKLSAMTNEDIGLPVMHRQQKESEYGIITGYNETHVFVHFNNLPGALVLRDINLYWIKIKN